MDADLLVVVGHFSCDHRLPFSEVLQYAKYKQYLLLSVDGWTESFM